MSVAASRRLAARCRWLLCLFAALAVSPLWATVEARSEVRVERTAQGYELQVNGAPFFVRGAGLEHGDRSALAARGGNAFRTWRVDNDRESGKQVLDKARAQGLFVALGLEMGRERHGFDYDDQRAVAAQLKRLRKQVLRYRDHPALLMWVVGNELNLEARNPRVWNALNDVLLMIREVDPHHPALTPLAGFDAALIADIKTRAPALSLLGVQLYGDIGALAGLREAGWTGPYLVTEWGPTGHWEVEKTPWGAPIEASSAEKASLLAERYQRHLLTDPGYCLGSFVFLWGHKQERTPTWYGMFLASGEATAAVDAMQQQWSGRWPDNRSPHVDQLRLDGRLAEAGIVVSPRQPMALSVQLNDPDGDRLKVDWAVREESRAASVGGEPERVPPRVLVSIEAGVDGQATIIAPRRAGAYRVFVTVRDGRGQAGHANLPFRVRAPAEAAAP